MFSFCLLADKIQHPVIVANNFITFLRNRLVTLLINQCEAASQSNAFVSQAAEPSSRRRAAERAQYIDNLNLISEVQST